MWVINTILGYIYISDEGISLLSAYVSVFCFGAMYGLYKTYAVPAGIIPLSTTDEQKKSVIGKLAQIGELDNRRYCYTCNVMLWHSSHTYYSI